MAKAKSTEKKPQAKAKVSKGNRFHRRAEDLQKSKKD